MRRGRAAKILGVGVQRVTRYREAGELKAKKKGAQWNFDVQSVLRLKGKLEQSRTVKPPSVRVHVLYIRVSDGSKRSEKKQDEKARAWCGRLLAKGKIRNLEVVKIVDHGRADDWKQRGGFIKLVDLIENLEVDTVLVTDKTRIAYGDLGPLEIHWKRHGTTLRSKCPRRLEATARDLEGHAVVRGNIKARNHGAFYESSGPTEKEQKMTHFAPLVKQKMKELKAANEQSKVGGLAAIWKLLRGDVDNKATWALLKAMLGSV